MRTVLLYLKLFTTLNVVALENFDLHTSACTCSLGRFNNAPSIVDMYNVNSAMAE